MAFSSNYASLYYGPIRDPNHRATKYTFILQICTLMSTYEYEKRSSIGNVNGHFFQGCKKLYCCSLSLFAMFCVFFSHKSIYSSNNKLFKLAHYTVELGKL